MLTYVFILPIDTVIDSPENIHGRVTNHENNETFLLDSFAVYGMIILRETTLTLVTTCWILVLLCVFNLKMSKGYGVLWNSLS